MTEWAHQLHRDNAPAHSTALVQPFLFGKASHHLGLSATLQPRFGSLRILAFPKAKIAVVREEMWMRRSHSTQAHATASHCRLTSPTGEWLFRDIQWGLLWLAAKLHQGHATDSRDIQNGRIHSGQPSYVKHPKIYCVPLMQFPWSMSIRPKHVTKCCKKSIKPSYRFVL